MYTVAELMEERLNYLEENVKKLPDQYESGTDGAQDPSENNAIWRNTYNAFNTLDKIFQIWEELVVIKAEYIGAKAVSTSVFPADYVAPESDGQKDVNLLLHTGPKYAFAETLSFAQVDIPEDVISAMEEYSFDHYSQGINAFDDAPESSIDTPFGKNRDKMQELEKLEPIYRNALDTLEIHNLMQALPTHRDIYIEYEKIKKLHEKSLEMLGQSNQCVIDYLGNYYNDPEGVWSGVKMGKYVYAHEIRKGISGWAINAFDIAKASKLDSYDSSAFAEPQMTLIENTGDLSQIDKLDIDTESNGFINTSTQEEVEKNSREKKLLSWQIGREAAKMMVEDQYTGSSKWGTATKRFPVWNDQKNFYRQYLDGKYDNIKEYLEYLDLRETELDIAVALVEATIQDVEERYEILSYLTTLSTIVKGIVSSDPMPSEASLDVLSAEKVRAIEAANAAYQNSISSLTAQRGPIISSLDAAAERLNSLREQYNTAIDEANQAGVNATYAETEISIANERYGSDIDTRSVNAKSEKETTTTAETVTDFNDMGKEVVSEEVLQSTFVAEDPYKDINPKTETTTETEVKDEVTEGEAEESTEEISSKITQTNVMRNLAVQEKEVEAESYEGLVKQEFPESEQKSNQSEGFRKRPSVSSDQRSSYISAETLMFAQNVYTIMERTEEDFVETNDVGEYVETLTTTEDASTTIKTTSTTTETTAPTEFADEEEKAVGYGEEYIEIQKNEYTEAETTSGEITDTAKVDEQKTTVVDPKGEIVSELTAEKQLEEQIQSEKNALASRLDSQIKSQEAIVSSLKAKLEKIDEQIEAAKQAHVIKVQSIDNDYTSKISKAREQLADARKAAKESRKTLYEIYESKVKPSLITSLMSQPLDAAIGSLEDRILNHPLEKILKNAVSLSSDTQEYMAQAVEDAKQEMYNLGDNLFYPSTNSQVVGIHSRLISKLKTLPIMELSQYSSTLGSLLPYQKVAGVLTALYQPYLVDTACLGTRCETADSQYFIGNFGKEKDFAAPKAPPATYLPPLREVIHFDEVDYANLAKDGSGNTTRKAFTEYGQEIPEIWKVILQDDVFIERSINLEELLNQGGEGISFISGGRYPCNVGSYTMYIIADDDKYLAVSKEAGNTYPTCVDIEVSGGGSYLTVTDLESDTSGQALTPYALLGANMSIDSNLSSSALVGKILSLDLKGPNQTLEDSTSELGTFLKASGNLAIADSPYKIFKRLQEIEEEMAKENNKYEASLEDAIYKKAVFENNQIGNFLIFVELELEIRQQKDEMEMAINENRKLLIETLESLGYEVAPNINLANVSEYNEIVNMLDNSKNSNVSRAVSDMGMVIIENNEIVEERLNKLKNIFNALQKDKNELVSLSEVVDSGSALDEKITAEEVNLKTKEEYGKRAAEEWENNVKMFPRPYCASY
jgi:hypothetical protein